MSKRKATAEVVQPTENEAPTGQAIPEGSNLPVPTVPDYDPGLALFAGQVPEGRKVKRLSRPPIIAPAKVAKSGVTVSGEIMEITDSTKAQYRSKLMRLRHASGREFMFPATAVILCAFADYLEIPREKLKLDKFIGRTIFITGLGTKPGTDGRAATNLFEVSILE